MPEKRGLEEESESVGGVETGVKRACVEPENGRPGDWLCPSCSHHNWSFRDTCQKCFTGKDGQKSEQAPATSGKPGDWNCSTCAHLNYAFRAACQRCHTPAPLGGSVGVHNQDAKGESRPGDWNCPTCGDLVYASRFSCRKCNTPKSAAGMGMMAPGGYVTHQTGYPGMDPMAAMGMGAYGMGAMGAMGYGAATGKPAMGGGKPGGLKEMRAGDWSCPKCFDINYSTRTVCRLCNTPKSMAGSYADPAQAQVQAQSAFMYGYPDMTQAYGDMYGFSMGAMGGAAAPTGGGGGAARRGGDWDCPNCGDIVYSTRNECRKCKTSKPDHLGPIVNNPNFSKPMNGGLGPSRRAGDWDCTGCGDVQYASRTECRKCRTAKPE
jgi:hypothetical protein